MKRIIIEVNEQEELKATIIWENRDGNKEETEGAILGALLTAYLRTTEMVIEQHTKHDCNFIKTHQEIGNFILTSIMTTKWQQLVSMFKK